MDQLPKGLQPLTEYHQFIIWQLVPDTPKPRKVPINVATMQPHNAHDRAIQMDAKTAIETANVLGEGYGVGFDLTKADPFFCIDIDHCIGPDGQLNEISATLTQVFSMCYIEISMSGTGLHIIGKGECPPHRNKNSKLNIELYTEQQFIALTGNTEGWL